MKVGIAAGDKILRAIDRSLEEISGCENLELHRIKMTYSYRATKSSRLSNILLCVDRLMSRGRKIWVRTREYPEAAISSMDIIINWQSLLTWADAKKEIWTFWLNDEPFDHPMAGLKATLDRGKPMTLSIKKQTGPEDYSIIYYVQMRPARTLSKTRERAACYFGIMLRKCLQGDRKIPVDQSEFVPEDAKYNPSYLLFRLIINNIKELLFEKRKASKSYWRLYTAQKGELPRSNQGMRCISPPEDRFWADPFPVKYNEKNYLFVEEFFYQDRKGIIAVLEQGEDGDFKKIATALKKSSHLSYPHIFFIDNKLYMIPETGSENKAQLYECILFPDHWKKVRDLVAGVNATDTTVFFFNNLWWIFTSFTKGLTSQDEQLFLYYTDNLITGELIPHPENPIVVGADCSRMAGNIFVRNQKIYRPAQDCSRIYGGRVVIMEIDQLTKTRYRERLISSIEPMKGLKGLHTYNEGHDYLIVDAY